MSTQLEHQNEILSGEGSAVSNKTTRNYAKCQHSWSIKMKFLKERVAMYQASAIVAVNKPREFFSLVCFTVVVCICVLDRLLLHHCIQNYFFVDQYNKWIARRDFYSVLILQYSIETIAIRTVSWVVL